MKKWKNILTVLAIVIFLFLSQEQTFAASKLYIEQNGKKITYTGKQLKLKVNGTKKLISSTPGIITTKGYAMMSYYYMYVNSSIKAKKTYNSKAGTLKITLGSNVVSMTLNSKTAYVNGKKVTLPEAPVKTKYRSSNKTVILVPARAVTGYLGLSYTYSSVDSTVSISKKVVASSTTSSTEDTKKDSTKTYYTYNGKSYVSSKVSFQYNGSLVSMSSTPVFIKDNYVVAPYYYALKKSGPKVSASYSSSTKKLTLTRDGVTLVVTVGSKTAYLNGKEVSLPMAPFLAKYDGKSGNNVIVPLKSVATYLGLSYSYSSSTKTVSCNPGISICYNGSYSAYTRTKVGLNVNGTLISSNISGILINNTTLIPAYSVFKSTYGLGVTYSYSSSTKKATFTRGSKKVIVTMGSKSAIVNGMTKTMPEPALLIYLTARKTSYVMVPGEFVTESLGLSYSYSSGRSYIKGTSVSNTGSTSATTASTSTSVLGKKQVIVVLDAGHGGSDSGATAFGYKEKDMNLAIVKEAKKYFDQDSNFKVYYTRLTDTYPSLSQRYKLANDKNADIFISVHINSASASATGTETLYNPDRNKKNSGGLSCSKLAEIVHSYVLSATGFKNRGLKERCSRLNNGLAVLNNNDGPATLVEIGFISNSAEAKKMASNYEKYGKALYNAVVSAASKYPKK